MKMGEAMYKDQQAAGTPGEGAEQNQTDTKDETSKDDDVIDADFEEVDENKDDKEEKDDKKASGQ